MSLIRKIVRDIKKPKTLLIIQIVIFVLFTSYLALNLKMGLSPDSSYHLEVSREYSSTLGIPENNPNTYQWRDITRIPYLSLWINGRILNFNSITFNIDQVTILRFFNILCSVGTLLFAYLISKETIKSKWGQLLPVFLLSNTLMFLFLSSSISYDNLIQLLCTASIYFFVKYMQKPKSLINSLMIFILLTLGTLTKNTVLPLAFIVTILWFVVLVKRKVLNKEFFEQFKEPLNIFLTLSLLFLVFLNLKLYGLNILDFGKLLPDCTDMLTHEQCLENGVYYRDIYKIPKVFEWNILEAVKLILKGDRIDPIRYFPYWLVEMSKKVFGIMGDRSLYMKYEYLPFYFVYFFIFISQIFKNRKKLSSRDRALIYISLFYAFTLYFYHNYKTYIIHNWPDLALQGRYIFPVIVPIYVVFSKYFLEIKNKKILKILTAILIVGFLLGGIGYFLIYVPKDWYI